MQTSAKVSIRLNMDTGIYPQWSRFGFNFENGEAMEVAKLIKHSKKLSIKGVHVHIGTFIIEPSAYAIAARKLASFAKDIEKNLGFEIEYIDLGGGFTSSSTLLQQYSPGNVSNPSMSSYAIAITSALLGAGFSPNRLPTLILETGRALVDDSGFLLTSVVANKRLPNGVRSLIIDAGVNTLFTSFWYKHEILLTKEPDNLLEETIIYGPLCMNIDVVRESIRLPPVNVGETLVIKPVGAYNVTQSMQFIYIRPQIVMIGQDGNYGLIRKKEDINSLKQFEIIPEWLK